MTSGRGKKILSPAELSAALVEVAEIAKRDHVSLALAGGYAMQVYGSDRLTGDIDVIATGPIGGLPPGEPLLFGGTSTFAPNGVPTDVIVRSDKAAKVYRVALTQAKRTPGVPIPVVRPEHLAVMKMIAGRDKDMLDLNYLVMSGEMDLTEARAVIEKHLGWFAANEFDNFVAETRWKASRGK